MFVGTCGVCTHNMNTCVCQGLKLMSAITLAHSSSLLIEAGFLSHTSLLICLVSPASSLWESCPHLPRLELQVGCYTHTVFTWGLGSFHLPGKHFHCGASFPSLSPQPFSTSEQKQVPISGWQFALVSLISPLGRRDSSYGEFPKYVAVQNTSVMSG